MPVILISGGTGLVGKHLSKMLTEKGYEVIILTRKLPDEKVVSDKISYALWDIEEQFLDTGAIQKADYIIHLAGAGFAEKKWTADRKKEIKDSRIQSSVLLLKSLQTIPNKIKAVISASATGWYGQNNADTYIHGFIEDDPACNDFTGETCRLWEESILPVTELGKRLVRLRIGIVLSKDGGALSAFMKPLQYGIAAILGSGNQTMSWIHIDDLCRLFVYAIEHEELSGVYNAVAPHSVNNKQLVLLLARTMRGKFYISVFVPSFVLRLLLGEMSGGILKSIRVCSHKVKHAGFTFLYPELKQALQQLFNVE